MALAGVFDYVLEVFQGKKPYQPRGSSYQNNTISMQRTTVSEDGQLSLAGLLCRSIYGSGTDRVPRLTLN